MLYKKIKIENLENIQKEILLYIKEQTDLSNKIGFQGIDTSDLKNHSTALKYFLENHNLFSRWRDTGVSIFEKTSIMKVHTDSFNLRTYALNIPICNCDNSFTVWYKLKNDKKSKFLYYKSGKSIIVYNQYEQEDVFEIERLESSNPAFVNVREPHNGESFNQNKRILISLRFTPELTKEEILLFN